jgi:hypothetical protein
LLPGGRDHGLISQMWPYKKIVGREKSEAVKKKNGGRECSKEAV